MQNAHASIAGLLVRKLGKAPALRALASESTSFIDDVNKGGRFFESVCRFPCPRTQLITNKPIDGALQMLEARGVSFLTSSHGYNRRLIESRLPFQRISGLGKVLLKVLMVLRPVPQMRGSTG